NLLISALERAFSLAKMHYSTPGSRENLDFDVPWFLEEFLQIQLGVSESCVRLRAGCLEAFFEFLDGFGDSHPSAASAESSLQKNRESDFPSLSLRLLDGFNFPVSARDDWDSCGLREPLGFELVRHVA